MSTEFALRTFSRDEALVKERRSHVVRCSTRVFTKKGYDPTNMRELAKACDMSVGTLYHYFGSKEEILYSIINDATLRQAEYIEHFYETLDQMDAISALRELIRKFFEWHDSHQDITLFIYQETRSLPPKAQRQIFESEGRIQAVLEKILKKGTHSGQFNGGDPGLMAHNIVVLGHAWALRRWFLGKHWTFATYLREQTEAMLKVLTRKEDAAPESGESRASPLQSK